MYIATFDQYVGRGKTLNEAYEDVKESYDDELEVESCFFYEAKEIKVVHEIKTLPVTTVRKATTTNEKGNTCKSK